MSCTPYVEQSIFLCVDTCVFVSFVGPFIDLKTVPFENLSTAEEEFDDIYKVVFD